MIERIRIKNYRSIKYAEIELSSLTVIVGANNTGKSNLIKAFEFIGDIARDGLDNAVIQRGGFEEILPKAYSGKELNRLCSFNIDFTLPPKTDDKRIIPCKYQISFGKDKDKEVRIRTETTTFNDVLWLGSIAKKDIIPYKESSSLNVELRRGEKKIRPTPPNEKENIDLYLKWLLSDLYGGLESFREMKYEDKIRLFNQFMYLFLQTKGLAPSEEKFKIIEKEYTSIFQTVLADICPQLKVIKSVLSNINRYDLLIQELRKEQTKTSDRILNKNGSNLPPLIRWLCRKDKGALERIMATLTTISPSIKEVDSKPLKNIKEYVFFNEFFGGREIESWESSDGSLRALGILIALESQKENSVILIEEPEIGLHPWAIEYLIDHIRNLIEKKSLQVIITTHSDMVLEQVNRDEVLICMRDNEGTKFKKIKDIRPNTDEDMEDIGRLWKKGLLKGVPEWTDIDHQ
jgi:predicted ATPase